MVRAVIIQVTQKIRNRPRGSFQAHTSIPHLTGHRRTLRRASSAQNPAKDASVVITVEPMWPLNKNIVLSKRQLEFFSLIEMSPYLPGPSAKRSLSSSGSLASHFPIQNPDLFGEPEFLVDNLHAGVTMRFWSNFHRAKI
jgi:hypothetical protein